MNRSKSFFYLLKLQFLGLIISTVLVGSALAEEQTPRVLIIYDSSNSMWGELADGARKYEAGRAALATIVGQGFGGREIGFRAYGHRSKQDCRDSELISAFGPEDVVGAQITTSANAIRPTGKTPITYSLTEGLKDLGDHPGDILLVSDGVETCDADPCALMREWKDRDINIRVHVVGVGLNEVERQAMACIADTSGGTYFDADSTEGFETALIEAGEVIEAAEPAEQVAVAEPAPKPVEPATPDPKPEAVAYTLIYRAFDSAGRQYVDAAGTLWADGAIVATGLEAQGRGRNVLQGPGEFELEVGAVLQDGSVYEPTRVPVTIDTPGETIIDVTVAAPARVTATFTELGEPHPGALISAYQNGEEVFRFRPQDEALARPGTYEFRSQVNADNVVTATATLVGGEQTTVAFELAQTVRTLVQFQLTDGSVIKRNSVLLEDGAEAYSLHGSNGGDVKPGTYTVVSDDQNLPLPPTDITVAAKEGQTYTVALPTAWVTITYADDLTNYFGERLPGRAQLHSLDRGNWSHSAPATAIPVAPGNYKVMGFEKDGFVDPVEVTVDEGDRVNVMLTPKPLGELVVTYAASDSYDKAPDRAFVYALDGQTIVKGFMRPGAPEKFLPGRYRVEGRGNGLDVPPVEIEIHAGERAQVTLTPVSE